MSTHITQSRRRPRLQLFTLQDFTGGLNLAEDGFPVAENETPDCLNVDLGMRGGFGMRNGVAPFHTSDAAANLISLWTYENILGTKQIMVSTATKIYTTTGGAFSDTGAVRTSSNPTRAATFKDICYIQNGIDAGSKWDGTTFSALTATYNDNLQVPDNGDLPISRLIVNHMGRLFIADTLEGGTRYANRIRWSFPNFPEDWRSFDFIDIDQGHDGDYITALVPFGDRLYIFKRNSVYVLIGYDQDTFQVLPLSRDYGAVSQEAAISTELGVFFFHWPTGVHVTTGKAPTYLWSKLRPAITDELIPDAYVSGVTMGYHNQRVYCSVPYGTSTKNARTYVYDTNVGKGAWTVYDLGLGQFHDYRPDSQTAMLLAIDKNRQRRVLKLDQPTLKTDDFGAGATHINSYYFTSWFTAGSAALAKRWKRTLVTVSNVESATLSVEFYHDYDAFTKMGTFGITTSAPDASGSGLVWDSGNWDDDTWQGGGGVSTSHRDTLMLTAGLGICDSVRLKFVGPTTNNSWFVHQIHYKTLPRRLH